jgi:hypothetical protein
LIYEAQCQKCKKNEDYSRSIAERHDTPVCCGQPMKKMITTCQNVYGDLDFVTADITGQDVHITSRKHHADLCRKNHVAPVGLKGEF